jgi:hypothetical protein
MLNAKSLKVTVVLDATEVAALPNPTTDRVTLQIKAAGQPVTADIAAKSLRKVKDAIAQHGADGVAVIVQGKLVGAVITEAGLAAQPKVPAAKQVAA